MSSVIEALSSGTWLVSAQTLDGAGHPFNAATVKACQGSSQGACAAVLDRLHLRDLIAYQPAGRFWPLQWYETAIFLALAAILAGVCLWRIRLPLLNDPGVQRAHAELLISCAGKGEALTLRWYNPWSERHLTSCEGDGHT